MSKKSLLLNRTLLISLVRERPAIWDKTMKIYKCKRAKAKAWREICVALNKDYERLEPIQRKEYFKQLIRMWTHIRDSWMKSMKDKRNRNELTKPYIYHEQLLFLKKIFRPREVCQNSEKKDETEKEENAAAETIEHENSDASGFSMEIQEMFGDDGERRMSKKSLVTNRIQLISLVREKPAIWDKTTEIYKNKHAKEDAWREICCKMNKYYEQMNNSKRKEYFKLLISIWTQIRDTWMRSVKNKSARPYKYHGKLLFLKKVISSPHVFENIRILGENEQEIEMEDENESVDTNSSSIRRHRMDGDDREYTYCIESQARNNISQSEAEDRNYSFFKSIQPTLAFFNDDQILQFQAGTISLLQRIKTEQNYNEFQQHRTPKPNRALRVSEEESSSLNQDPIKIETYDIS